MVVGRHCCCDLYGSLSLSLFSLSASLSLLFSRAFLSGMRLIWDFGSSWRVAAPPRVPIVPSTATRGSHGTANYLTTTAPDSSHDENLATTNNAPLYNSTLNNALESLTIKRGREAAKTLYVVGTMRQPKQSKNDERGQSVGNANGRNAPLYVL